MTERRENAGNYYKDGARAGNIFSILKIFEEFYIALIARMQTSCLAAFLSFYRCIDLSMESVSYVLNKSAIDRSRNISD